MKSAASQSKVLMLIVLGKLAFTVVTILVLVISPVYLYKCVEKHADCMVTDQNEVDNAKVAYQHEGGIDFGEERKERNLEQSRPQISKSAVGRNNFLLKELRGCLMSVMSR